MGISLQSLPKKSSQLDNKGASSLIKFFEEGGDVLYLYGPTGSGKSMAVSILVKEYGYEIVRAKPPFNEELVGLLCARSIFMKNRKLVLVDAGSLLKTKDIKVLSKGVWGDTKLVIIGDEYPKKSPLRKHFRKKDYKYVVVKFHSFSLNDVRGCLSLYALELGVDVCYEIINKIADYANGDMRAARMTLRALIASEDEEAVDVFLPIGERSYRSEIIKLFSGDEWSVREAIDVLKPYLTILILRENVLKFLPDEMQIIELLYEYSNLDMDVYEELVNLAIFLGKKIKTYSYVYYRKPRKVEVPDIDVDCSDAKKILYYSGFVKLMGD